MPTQILPAASLSSARRLPAARTLFRAANYMICSALSSIGRAIFRGALNFLPVLRERRVPALPDIWNPYRRQLARPMQPRQAGRVAPIGLDPIAGTPPDQRWRNHDALVPVPRQVTLDAMAPPPRLIAEPKPHTLAPELAQQTVQGRRGVRDPAVFPDLAERATLGHRHDDPFLVNIKPNVCDTIRQDPSPMHEARHPPIGVTLSICIP